MKPKLPGTILATESQMREADAFADRQRANDEAFAAKHRVLSKCERRVVGGETRYYLRPDCYALARRQRIRWFRVLPDGDHSISAP